MEILNLNAPKGPVRAVLFDFDGTISTLRHGWEEVMKPLMLEMICPSGADKATEAEVDRYIDASTGIQTIRQMQWLADTVREKGMNPTAPDDPWWYKAEYNRRLMERVNRRVESLVCGADRDQYLISGSVAFLEELKSRNIRLFVASGTDDPDVKNEAKRLGVADYFDVIAGSPIGSFSCSKEKVISDLIELEGFHGDDFAVIGDGKVEIRLGRGAGARTLGLATDEGKRRGVDLRKRARLIEAGADAIAGDFEDIKSLMAFLGLI